VKGLRLSDETVYIPERGAGHDIGFEVLAPLPMGVDLSNRIEEALELGDAFDRMILNPAVALIEIPRRL
jgi:hypothetical protein